MEASPAPVLNTGKFKCHRAVLVVCLILVALTVFVYWPVVDYPFINYDDPVYVSQNPHVAAGLSLKNVAWALRANEGANWHPVTWLSHLLDAQCFGLKPGWHHLTSLLLHIANTLLLWFVLRCMTGSNWRSGLVAALFAAHPLHVESVAWLAERKDVLSGLFFMLALLAYAGYVKRQGINRSEKRGEGRGQAPVRSTLFPLPSSVSYALTLLAFTLGLMSKPMLVTLPFVLLLLDYWPLQRLALPLNKSNVTSLLVEKVPLCALAAASSVITLLVQRGAGAVEGGLPLSVRLENAVVSCGRYVLKTFWPVDLSVIYPHPVHWPVSTISLSGLVVAAISACALIWARRRPWLMVGWLWFLGMLVPVIGLVQVGSQSIADRYMYLPMIGLLVAVVWAGYGLAEWRPSVVAPLSALGVVAVLVCAAVARDQLGYWQSNEALFHHAIAVTTNNALAHNCLAAALVDQGKLDEAIDEYRLSLRYWPQDAIGHNRLAGVLAAKGRYDEAISEFREALRWNPNDYASHNNLGVILVQQGRMDEALEHFREAVRLQPGDPTLHNSLAAALFRKGQLDEAIAQYRQAVQIWPEFAKAHHGLGMALARKGLLDDAISHLQTAVRLQPNYEEAQKHLATALRLKAAATNSSPNAERNFEAK
jgi:Flp pilus assembly protein TadD